MFCKNCGHKMLEIDQFCEKCGFEVEKTDFAERTFSQPIPRNGSTGKKNKKRTVLTILILAVLIISAFFSFSKGIVRLIPATETLYQVVGIDVSLTNILLNDGIQLMSEEKYGEAIVVYDRIIEREPDTAQAYLNMAEAFLKMGNAEKAQGALIAGCQAIPKTKDYT